MLMWVMSDRAIPRSYRMMQGFGVHTFRLVNAEGESHFVKFHWTPAPGTAFAGLGRSSEDLRRRSRLPSARSVGGDRGGRLSRVGAGLQIFTEEQAEAFDLRRARSDQARPRRAGAGHAGRQAGAEPQPGQLLRRDRAGGVLHGAHRARASTSPTIRCWPAASTRTSTRRSRGWADRTFTRSRSTRRSRRCTTTSATACTARRSIAAASPTSPIRSAAAARSRPARPASSRFRSRWSRATHKVRGKAERFADHYTQATLFWNSQTPSRSRTSSTRSASSCRGCRRRPFASGWCRD